MNSIESSPRRQRHYSASGGQCAFGQPMPAMRITVTIRQAGELVLIVRDMSSRETHAAMRVLRQLFPAAEGYAYTVDATPETLAPAGGDAA